VPAAKLTVTYLEMFQRPAPTDDERALAFDLLRDDLDPAVFLDLFRAVGDPWSWDGRTRLSADELMAFLADPKTIILTLHLSGRRIGFCESIQHNIEEIEITHFGLIPDMLRRGIGPRFLRRALESLWDMQPKRIWLHTDTKDHPKALEIYQRAGFKIFDIRQVPSGQI
jgi:ribosomal protein S18 acetylase RimI-like enzyme